MTEWTFLFSQLIHFLMEKKFSFFEKNISEAFEKVPPLCGSLLVYVETKQDRLPIGGVCLVWWGYHAICRALYGEE